MKAAVLYLAYLFISLLDPWGYVPAFGQLGAFILLFLAMITVIFRSLTAHEPITTKGPFRAFFLSIIIFVIAGIWAGPDVRRRIELAVKPRAIFSYPVPEITLEVTPPSYSGQDRYTERLVAVGDAVEKLAPVLEGSHILMHVDNTPYAPTLIAGQRQIEFLKRKKNSFAAKFTAGRETDWQIRQGSFEIGKWPIETVEDEAPIIGRAEFSAVKEGDGLLSLSLNVRDDYGLDLLSVIAVRPGGDMTETRGEVILPITDLKTYDGDIFVDLTASPYAGKSVDLIITAQDIAGQSQHMRLPAIPLPIKDFSTPLSRRIVEIRRDIYQQPAQRVKLARRLMALGLTSGDISTPAVFHMALRSAYWRLTKPAKAADVYSANDMLWDLALKLEEGQAGQFKRNMLDLLASLKLSLYQKKDLSQIRRKLQEIDREIIIFLRDEGPLVDEHYIDVKALRKIYSKILHDTHHKKYEQVIGLVTYLEHGFIRRDGDMLSGQGFARFQMAHNARNSVYSFERIQRQILLASDRTFTGLALGDDIVEQNKDRTEKIDMKQWASSQQKLGDNISDLGQLLMGSGIDASSVTISITDLVRDTVQNLETGNIETARQNQTEIMFLLKSLKNLLDEELQFDPLSF